MSRIVTLPDGRRIITSNGSRNKNKRRAGGAPVAMSNNRLAKRAAMTDMPATPRTGANNDRVNRNRRRVHAAMH